jgi:hypothetical protein
MIKEDFVQAKRHVLAVLRVQTGRTLYDVLVVRPEEVHEQRWLEEVYRDIALEKARAAKHNLPPTPVEAGYQIESIRSCVQLAFPRHKNRPFRFAGLTSDTLQSSFPRSQIPCDRILHEARTSGEDLPKGSLPRTTRLHRLGYKAEAPSPQIAETEPRGHDQGVRRYDEEEAGLFGADRELS